MNAPLKYCWKEGGSVVTHERGGSELFTGMGAEQATDTLPLFNFIETLKYRHFCPFLSVSNISKPPQIMTATPIDALKSLSELALSAPGLEPLVVYDSVATIAAKLAAALEGEECRDMASAAEIAVITARAVRDADRCTLDFREFLAPGGDV